MLPIGAGDFGTGGVHWFGTAFYSVSNIDKHEIAQVAYLVSEGPIEGLSTGDLKSVYLNDVPVQNEDGSFNFKGITFAGVRGTNTQAVIPGFTDVETEVSSGAEIKFDTPQILSITDVGVDAVRVKVIFNALQRLNPDGSTASTFVVFKVSVSTDGGAYVSQALPSNGFVIAQSSSLVAAAWRIELPRPGTSWSVKIERITADATDIYTQDKSYLEGYTKLYDARMRYPNSAIMCIAFDAKAFGSIPRVAFKLKMRQIQIPANYDPIARTYATTGTGTSGGVWDGTFKTAWSNNPAWVLWDMATHKRYGTGQYLDTTSMDKWGLYSFGQYCDALVADGKGGTEPRFTCNLWMGGREDAIKVLSNLASIFQAQTYLSAGLVKWVQDVDASPVHLFSPSNVVGGKFTYAGTAKAARHTAAIVTWNDPAKNYQAVPHYEADEPSIARYGLNIATAVAMGCTSEGQATRYARSIILAEKLQQDAVTFQTGLEGLAASPGDIILIQDPAKTMARFGGRLVSATTTSATLDAPITLTASVSYTIYLVMPDGTVQSRVLTNAPGSTSVLTWTSALPATPLAFAQWSLWATLDTPSKWRITGIRPVDKLTVEISALYHDSSKYALIENGFTLGSSSSPASLAFKPPVSVSVAETVWVQANGSVNSLQAIWTAPSVTVQPVRYDAVCSFDYGAWQKMDVAGTMANFSPVQPGSYRVRVVAVYGSSSLTERYSPFVEVAFSLTGKTTPPSDVQNFRLSRSSGKLMATWDPIRDVDLGHYELRTGPSWETGTSLLSTVATSAIMDRYQGGNYWLKAWDTSGNASANAALIIISADTIANVVVTADDSLTSWPGTRTNFTTDSFGLIAVSGSSPAVYTTAVVDLGASMPVRVEFTPDIRQAPQGVTWSSWTAAWSTYTNPWQGPAGTVSATYEMRTSVDNLVWTNWAVYAPGTYTARYYQFRVTATTTDTTILPRIYALPVTLDVPDRIVKIPAFSIGIGGTSYTFSPPYVGLQTVQVTVLNGAAGDTVKVTAKSTTGFTVTLFDSTGTSKAGTADITTFGYGQTA